MTTRDPLRCFLFAAAAVLGVSSLTGCSGCRQDPLVDRKTELDEEGKKKKEAPKEDFEIDAAIPVPSEGAVGRPLAKPGHWTSVFHEVRANNFDYQAQLQTAATNQYGEIYPVENTAIQLVTTRPAVLPKGQLRVFESLYYIPYLESIDSSIWLNRELRAATGGRLISQDRVPIAAMKDYQYFLVVLASDPDRYAYLKRLTSVAAPTAADIAYGESLFYYSVLLPKFDSIAPLPSHSLTWSSMAYLVWDDVNRGVFTAQQETALLDWLHWGGQLIISGPNSLAKLKGSFLEPYLPAQSEATGEADRAAIDQLNQYWSIPASDSEPRTIELPVGSAMTTVRLVLDADAEALPHTGGLVVERRVGRGRIVVTAFSLTDRVLVNWPSFDSFVNGALLRRPRRLFRKQDFVADTIWADFPPSAARESGLVTKLRYFSRDVGYYAANRQRPAGGLVVPPSVRARRSGDAVLAERESEVDLPADAVETQDTWRLEGYAERPFGMASWNGRSGASEVARDALRDAAGISIPRGDFVMRVLAIYLVVLAPLNWGLFRLLGRVEWAWVAAPLIAVVGAFAVIRLAQLDIGFARSVTEVAIAEMHAGYPRAHLTRYSALYTSLSTGYEIPFEDPVSSVIQPLGASSDPSRLDRESRETVNLRREQDLRLTGFAVRSNSTGIVHCEQLVELGRFQLSGSAQSGLQLSNDTAFTLQDAGVLRRTLDGRLEAAWLGQLSGRTTVPLDFQPLSGDIARLSAWDESSATLSHAVQMERLLERFDANGDRLLARSEVLQDRELAASFDRMDADQDGRWRPEEIVLWCRKSRAGEVSMGELIDLASRVLRLGPGAARLIGWSDQALPGMMIRPAAAQTNRRTLFLVHLRHSVLPTARPDINTKGDVVEESDDLELWESVEQQPLSISGEIPAAPR